MQITISSCTGRCVSDRFVNVSFLQATAFLILGFVVMTGSMTLIILDWIHNATAGAVKHGDGH